MDRIKKYISRVLILAFFATSVWNIPVGTVFAAKGVQEGHSSKREKTELIVKYKEQNKAQSLNSSKSSMAAYGSELENIKNVVKKKLKLSKLHSKRKYKNFKTIELLEIGEKDNINNVVNELKKDPNIEYVQPNYKLTPAALPADPKFKEQWPLQNNGQEAETVKGRPSVDINAVPAWDLTKGSPDVVIGVLDTGIDISHKELKNSIYINKKETPGNGIDDDKNGYADDINGWDFANSDSRVFDSASTDAHGTAIAGIIAAASDTEGITGIAPNVKILPLKFINNGTGYTCDAIDAIEYAMSMGVKIINCSFGGSDNNFALKDTMKNSGILFLCAAGNRGGNVQSFPVYPACFDIPNVLSVGSINNRGVLDSASGYGSKIHVAAPGVNIPGTIPANAYSNVSGTSIATAHVTGIAALIKSYLPKSTITDIAGRIKNNVVVCAALKDKVSTSGRVDAYAALTNTRPQPDNYIPQPGDGGNNGQPGSGEYSEDMWYTMDQLARIKEKLHYGESGVSPASGNYSFTVNDMTVAAPGFQVNISRTYNSKDERDIPFGRGWTFGFEGSIAGESTVAATLPNGSVQRFKLDTATKKYTAEDSRSTLEKNSDDTYILRTKDQYTYGFNAKRWLVWMKDRNGNTVNLEVDDSGKVQKITDAAGRQYTIAYNGNGLIDNIKDPAGRVATYKYDSQNHLVKVIDPMNKAMNYKYDDYGYLTEIHDNDNNLVEKLVYNHSAGHTEGRVTQATDAYGDTSAYIYDVQSRKTTINENNSRNWVYWFDTDMYTIKTEDPEGKFTETAYHLYEGKNKYGDIKAATDRNGNRTQYEVDSRGNITKTTNPDGSTQLCEYDDKNNLIKETDEGGKSTCYIYDANKINLIKKVQPLNGTDTYTDGTSDAGKYSITTFAYYTDAEAAQLGCKAKGLLKASTDPEGNTTKYEYDANGYTTKTIDPELKETISHYNTIGWTDYSVSPGGNRTDYTYDKNGQLEKTSKNNGAEISRTTYDAMGKTIKEVSPNQYNPSKDDLANHTYNGAHGTKYTYYTTGLVKTITDAENNTTENTYDVYGNKTTETKPDGAVYRYEYDKLGRLVKVYFKEDKNTPDSEAKLLETCSYAILSDNRTQKTHVRNLNETDQATAVYIYDYAERLVEQQNPDGTKTKTSYNPDGTIAAETAENDSSTLSFPAFSAVFLPALSYSIFV